MNRSEVPEELVELLNYIGAGESVSSENYSDPYVRQLQKSVNDTKKSRKMEERFMMIEELMQEEYQAGKAEGREEGIAAGVDALKAVVLEVLDMRNMLTDTTKYLLEHTSDMETLKKMSHTAISCRNAEEFLKQFNA